MTRLCLRRRVVSPLPLAAWLCFHLLALGPSVPSFSPVRAEDTRPTLSPEEKRIAGQIQGLRSLADDVRARLTKQLALQVRGLPASDNKVRLANDLANLSTEGDFGHDTVQEVATTLAEALRERPVPADKGQPATPYIELAELVHFEHVKASLYNPQFAAAKAKTKADDTLRDRANFRLTDLRGKQWTLKDLRGKVVLVNFWATWCPPCRKEMPDLETLYNRFKGRGLVILAISDEEASKVGPFITERNITYPVLLDPGRKVNTLFQIDGIPKSFVYNRSGNLVAQSMDMRTQKQFLGMLAQAGLD
jgi:peroxiredoxin